ncbi:MAG: DUF4330 domain-containing protein [Defluviitaleaceae bacterium]|nr:DUF4330 domain-containing protein [Defluviitaleaceae bacterium]
MIDEKGKLFGYVSLIDIFVVVVIITIVVFGAMQLGNTGGIGVLETPQPLTMSFIIENLETFTADSISIGDPVFGVQTGVDFGHIVDIQRRPTIEYHSNNQGVLVASELPNHYQIIITAAFSGFPMQNGVWVMGHTFLVGETIILGAGPTNIFMNIHEIRKG